MQLRTLFDPFDSHPDHTPTCSVVLVTERPAPRDGERRYRGSPCPRCQSRQTQAHQFDDVRGRPLAMRCNLCGQLWRWRPSCSPSVASGSMRAFD